MSENRDVKTPTESKAFGSLPGGSEATLFTVRRGAVTAAFTDFGARLVSIEAPDRDGHTAHVVLGYSTAEQYVADRKTFMGAIVGRYGNRIAGGRFSLGGETFQVPLNDGVNALHGGSEGFDRKLWQAHALADGVEFTLVSPDGDMGFPGTLTLAVRYTLAQTDAGVALTILYSATSDKPTVVAVTNHAYFNLAGESSGSILDHEIMIPAAHYTPTDAALIPTGELAPVAGTPFDFRTPERIGLRISDADEQLKRAGGYDHNWVFGENGVMKTTARLFDPASGRSLTVETSEPGMQFYSGNFLDGSMPNRSGGVYAGRTGLCLETQHYPDSPNHPDFPTTTLNPGETLNSTTVLTFGVDHA